MEILKRIKNMLAVNAILYTILGIVMIIAPGFVSDFICYLIGVLILVFGISMIITFFNESYTAYAKGMLVLGLIASILGVYIILKPSFFMSIIPFMAGILILVESIDKFKHSFELKKEGYDKWYVIFTSAVILLVFSLILILYPFESVKLTIRVLGIILLIDSISDLLTIRSYTKTAKNIKKVIDMK